MKKSYFVVIILLYFITNNIFAHKEWVHQYIAQEAYRYLAQEIGFNIPNLKDHVGLNYYGKGNDDYPNETSYISITAWREDLEDVIWGYGDAFNGWTPSITHLGEADNGDDPENTFTFGRSDFHHTEGTHIQK